VAGDHKRFQKNKAVDRELAGVLSPLEQGARGAVQQVLAGFATDDPVMANTVLASKDEFNCKAGATRLRLARFQAETGRDALDSHHIVVEHLENLKRIRSV